MLYHHDRHGHGLYGRGLPTSEMTSAAVSRCWGDPFMSACRQMARKGSSAFGSESKGRWNSPDSLLYRLL